MRQKSFAKLVVVSLLAAGTITVTAQWVANDEIFAPFRGLVSPNGNLKKEEIKIQNEVKTATETMLKKDVPAVQDEIVYFILFNHLVGLQEKSQEMSLNGITLDAYRIYEERANLDASQSQFLFQIANDCIGGVKSVDAEAKKVIERTRAAMTKSEHESRDTVPAVPEELTDLQKKRNDTILRFRDQWKDFLGAERFSEFDSFARQMIVPNVTFNGVRKEER